MEFNHKSVLYDECIENLKINPDGIYIDGTIGGAGHSKGIFNKLSANGMLIGFDQDEVAVKISTERLKSVNSEAKFLIVNTNFSDIKNTLKELSINSVDGILLDLGVSSYQIETATRGFSYMHDAPLDMRMNRQNSLSAYEVVNEYDAKDLIRILREYGEEKWAVRIAEFIVNRRKEKKIETTFELVETLKMAIPAAARREGGHPGKRTFQAIRIEVNNELGILENTIGDAIEVLKKDGRLCIITFHSLEDRIIKQTFQKNAVSCICPRKFPVCVCGVKPKVKIITKKPIEPSSKEIEENSRSRSAKLRVIEKI